MKYEWANRREYAKQKAEDIIRNVEDQGQVFSTEDREFLHEEIVSGILSVAIDVREAELKASGKW